MKRTRAFKHEGNSVTSIISLDSNDIIITSTLEHLGHVVEIHTHGKVPVTPIMLKPLRSEKQSHKSNVAGIHSLQRETSRRTVEVRIVHQLLDRFQNLLEKWTLNETEFQHLDGGSEELGFWRLGIWKRMGGIWNIYGWMRREMVYIVESSRTVGGIGWNYSFPAYILPNLWRELYYFNFPFFYFLFIGFLKQKQNLSKCVKKGKKKRMGEVSLTLLKLELEGS